MAGNLNTDRQSSKSRRIGWRLLLQLNLVDMLLLLLAIICSIAAFGCGLSMPLLIQVVIDKVINQRSLETLNVLGTFLVILAISQALLTSLMNFALAFTMKRKGINFSHVVLERLLSFRKGYLRKYPIGELLRTLGDLNSVRGFLRASTLSNTMKLPNILLLFTVMWLYSPLLTLVAVSLVPVYIIIIFAMSRYHSRLIRKASTTRDGIHTDFIEALAYDSNDMNEENTLVLKERFQKLYSIFENNDFLLGTAAFLGRTFNVLASLTVIWVGASMVLAGDLTLGQLTAFTIFSYILNKTIYLNCDSYYEFQKVRLAISHVRTITEEIELSVT